MSSNDQPVPKLKDLSIHGRSGLNPSIQAKLRAFQQQRQSQSQLNPQSSQLKNSPSSTFSSSPQQSNQLLQTMQTQLNQSAQIQNNDTNTTTNYNNNILQPQQQPQQHQTHLNSNRSFENVHLTNNSSQNSLPHINTRLDDISNSQLGIDNKNIESFNNNKPLPPLPPSSSSSSYTSTSNSSSTNTPMTASPSYSSTPNQEQYLTANGSSNMDSSDSNYSTEDDSSTVVRRTSFRIPKSSTTPKSELDQDIMIKRSLSLERTLRQQQKFHNHHNVSSGYTQNSLTSNVNTSASASTSASVSASASASTRPASLPPLSNPKSNSFSELAMHLNSSNSNTNLSSAPLSSPPVPPLTISPNIHAQIQAHLQSQIQDAAKAIDSDCSDSSVSTPVNFESPHLNLGSIPSAQFTVESSNEESSISNDKNNDFKQPTQSPIDSYANSVTSSVGIIKKFPTDSSLSSVRTLSSHSSDGSSPSTPTLKSPVLRTSNSLQKKPSLSQRRGMKLNMKSLTGGNGGIDTDSPTTTQADIQQQFPVKSKQSPLSLKLDLNGLNNPINSV
ncbi:unnamed protein product [[Candida] boidinii]|uniref:Unnamed protein product n=1 Tax=Candida boidinii TaxID=5477 RepID=A0A9W6T626_CANBO|nr:unnamed protein product [[Candida] boidinii]